MKEKKKAALLENKTGENHVNSDEALGVECIVEESRHLIYSHVGVIYCFHNILEAMLALTWAAVKLIYADPGTY